MTFVLLILDDITGLRRAEEELRRYTCRLEDANRQFRTLNYALSRDVKEPLQAIHDLGGVLLESNADRVGAESIEKLTRIQALSLRLMELVDAALE